MASTDSKDVYHKDKREFNIYNCSYVNVRLSQGGVAGILLLVILLYILCLAFIRDENNKLDLKVIAGTYNLYRLLIVI